MSCQDLCCWSSWTGLSDPSVSACSFFWMFEALQRRKQLQWPHQTQHSAPPESGGPTRLPAMPGQGPQSAGTGNRPQPPPQPRHTSSDGGKVAAGSSPHHHQNHPAPYRSCSHGEVERSVCSKNTTQRLPSPAATAQLIPKRKFNQGK